MSQSGVSLLVQQQEIENVSKLVSGTLPVIEDIKAKTIKKRRAILRTWPLGRRLLTLLRNDPAKFREVCGAVFTLDQWYGELDVLEILLLAEEGNVIGYNDPITDLAANAWKKDLNFQRGEAVQLLRAFYSRMKSRVQLVSGHVGVINER